MTETTLLYILLALAAVAVALLMCIRDRFIIVVNQCFQKLEKRALKKATGDL